MDWYNNKKWGLNTTLRTYILLRVIREGEKEKNGFKFSELCYSFEYSNGKYALASWLATNGSGGRRPCLAATNRSGDIFYITLNDCPIRIFKSNISYYYNQVNYFEYEFLSACTENGTLLLKVIKHNVKNWFEAIQWHRATIDGTIDPEPLYSNIQDGSPF